MSGTVRALALMFLMPPALLFAWAHVVRPATSAWTDVAALALAGLFGLAGVATAPWSERARLVVAIAYGLAALLALPIIGLLAVCSTGDCL